MQKQIERNTNGKSVQSSQEDIYRYLHLYIGDTNWEYHIGRVFQDAKRKLSTEDAKQELKKRIACTILMPVYDKVSIPDPVHSLLYRCASWHQYNERDWVALMQDVVQKDDHILEIRKKLLTLGYVDPIEYSPATRQAYNWLYTSAVKAEDEMNEKQVVSSFKKLIYAYGGNTIINTFNKYGSSLNKRVFNWRSGYFFERLIHDTYSEDQLFKMKKSELEKTNKQLVKLI